MTGWWKVVFSVLRRGMGPWCGGCVWGNEAWRSSLWKFITDWPLRFVDNFLQVGWRLFLVSWGGGSVYEAWRSIERLDGPLQPSPQKHWPPITHTKSSSLHLSLPPRWQASLSTIYYLHPRQARYSIYLPRVQVQACMPQSYASSSTIHPLDTLAGS